MEVKETNVEFSYTKNMGNYESTKIVFGAKATVEPDESDEQVRAMLFEKISDEVMGIIDELETKK